jgi:UDP-glucose 4-epimerase
LRYWFLENAYLMKEKILVTGGLGFIGSHTVISLFEAGFEPIIVDNLSNSNIYVLDGIEAVIGYRPETHVFDILDHVKLDELFKIHNISAIIHFAAFKAVGESVQFPIKYYKNNVNGLVTLLEVMEKNEIRNIVFSSSCTVYGEPDIIPVSENNKLKPAESPYGATKQIGEIILKDNAHWCQSQCLRYFNPIGAHPSAKIGELPLGVPNNLIPFLTQSVSGLRDELTVYGNDYDTPDGTCIRDYIHVVDLADAHVHSVKRLLQHQQLTAFEIFNIGTGTGSSVLEVINTFEKVNGISVPHKIGDRRPGDVVKVWANTEKVNTVLGWVAKKNLEDMLVDAWNWQKSLNSISK